MILPTNGIINFYGDPCTGKTTFFDKNVKHVKLEHETLKSKEKTIDFMDRMRYSKLSVVIDDYEMVDSLTGMKEIKPLKNGLYIISSKRIESLSCQYKITSYYEHTLEATLSDFTDSLNNLSVSDVKKRIKNAETLTSIKTDSLSFNSKRDEYLSPKEYVHTLLTRQKPPSVFLDRMTNEHGSTFGLMQENFIDFVDDFNSISKITESFSDADIIDGVIYSDTSWNMVNYFNLCACLIPASHIQGPTPKNVNIRPGSLWTKYSNVCMRENRLIRLKIHRDCIFLIVKYINATKLNTLNFDSYDLDSLNQLSLIEKIVPKILSKLKKKLK
jgi:hypothetical protein